MFSISVVFSLFLLLIANGLFWRARDALLPFVIVVVGFAVMPAFICLMMPAVILHAVVLTIVAAVALRSNWRLAQFASVSLVATLAIYVGYGALAFQNVSRLLAIAPSQSMEERVPEPKVTQRQPLSASGEQYLDALEDRIRHDDSLHTYQVSQRLRDLKQLHENTLQVFANQPGFGVSRMRSMTERSLQSGLRKGPPLPQPGTRDIFLWSTGDLEGHASPFFIKDSLQNWSMHADALLDFVNPHGFGYFKDRRHVAGFQGHRFSKVPEPEKPWQLQTVDLLGLLMHDDPVVYVSDHLPRMDELRDVPLRPLDAFETAGLRVLNTGENLYVRDGSGGRRVLGAIRNLNHCQNCHGGERGDLLGAFSYSLVPAATMPATDKRTAATP